LTQINADDKNQLFLHPKQIRVNPRKSVS